MISGFETCANNGKIFPNSQGEKRPLPLKGKSDENGGMSALLSIDVANLVTPKAIGGRLRAIRKALKLSQAAFGEGAGVSRDVVNAWEQGKAYPAPHDVLAVVARFGSDFNYIYLGDERRVEAELLLAIKNLPEEKPRRKAG